MRESIVEKYLKDELKKIGVVCLKFTSPSTRGVPDRICLAKNGRCFFVETKSTTGSLRSLQENFIRRATSLGFDCYVVHSKEEVDRIVEREKELMECYTQLDPIKK